MTSDPRARAANVLARVWQDGAYATIALDNELSKPPPMSDRDSALTTELVYGVLRTQGFLEARVEALMNRGRPFDEPTSKAHLLIGMYTLLFLEKIPAFAAVSEAVTAVRDKIGQRPAGFVNFVLRETARQVERDPKARPALGQALVDGAPGWLRGALRRSLGRQGATEFLAAGATPAPMGIAVACPEDRATWITRLNEAVAAPGDAPAFQEGRWSPHAIVASRIGDPRRLPGFESDWIVQEEGAQVAALALGATPSDRVLDACAGRGNKTWLLAKLAGQVVATDRYPAKLAQLSARMAVETAAVDFTIGTGDLEPGFDRVLVDAPCSGVGTVRRRPEIVLRKDAESIGALVVEQVAITRAAAALARDGGRLVYAVCSVLREEAEAVVEQLTATEGTSDGGHVRLEPAPFDAPNLPCDAAATSFRLLPQTHGTDGYFVASFVVRR